jgi:Flp pilus assembly protein TadD
MKKRYLLLFICSLFAQENNLIKASSALRAGMFQEALMHISNSMMKNPKNSEVYKIKGLLHEALDEKENAIISWKDCIKYSKDERLNKEAKIHLKNLLID